MVTLFEPSARIELMKGEVEMYAIAFDLDTEMLKNTYRNESIGNAYGEIRKVMEEFGFMNQQSSVYLGSEGTNAVTCFEVTAELTERYDWFSSSVQDIRMLRIEDENDLKPVINRTLKQRKSS